MTQALARIAQATGYDREQVQLVKDTIARGASDDELILFLHLARRSGLDPFSRQIYLIERRQQVDGQWKTTKQPQTGIDGLRLIADRTDRYAPGREPSYTYDDTGELLTATAYVKKWVRGDWHEVAATAHYQEYVGKTGQGQVTRMWAEKPHIMLAKCAEALALRRAFPAEMSGLYTADEMNTEAHNPPQQLVNPRTGEITGHQNGASYQAEQDAKELTRREKLIARIAQLTVEAEAADLEIVLSKPISKMSDEELVEHGKNLNRALAQHAAQDLSPQGMPQEDLPASLPDVRQPNQEQPL